MVLIICSKDQTIVQTNYAKLTQVWSGDVINEPHKCGWHICYPKWHYHQLKELEFGLENCFPCDYYLHAHLMIPYY